jgi:hypothetical protein
MSLAFYASPIDYKNNDLENKIKSEKTKLDKNTLMTIQQGTLEQTPTSIIDIHKNLKEENENELSNFYKTEINPKQTSHMQMPEQYKTNDYMIMQSYEKPKKNNQDLLDKMNKILEMLDDQKEIKTGQKNEEIVLYSFLGIFFIYIMDSFVNIGRYSR